MGVLDLAKKLNKKYEDETLATLSDILPVYKRLWTGWFGLDYPLYGGLPYGRIVTFSGLNHSGKTTAWCWALGAYQRQHPDKTCVYVDVEHSLDLKFQARMNGIDLSKMVYFNPKTLSGEQILDAILEMENEDDIGMIVLDSIPALLPADSLEKDMTQDPGMRGTIAKSLHRFLPVMSNIVNKKENIFLMINQVRVSGKTFTGAPIYSEPGGQAPLYYSSIKIRFGTRTFIKGDKNDCNDGEGADGFRLKFIVGKNKCWPIARGGGFISYSYQDGLKFMDDMLEIAYKFDFIKRLNNVSYQMINLETGEVLYDENGNELKGKKKDLEQYLWDHKEFRDNYLWMLNKYISASDESYGDLLEKDEIAKLKASEESLANQ